MLLRGGGWVLSIGDKIWAIRVLVIGYVFHVSIPHMLFNVLGCVVECWMGCRALCLYMSEANAVT